jgi:hypothetical protein
MINENDIRIQFICGVHLLLFLIYISLMVSYQFLNSSDSLRMTSIQYRILIGLSKQMCCNQIFFSTLSLSKFSVKLLDIIFCITTFK